MSINKILSELRDRQGDDDTQWQPVSDLMSGLMILFLLIAIVLILEVRSTAEKYQDVQQAIYQALMREFQHDLKAMGAQIHPQTLTVVFQQPDILFETGESALKANYKKILDNFFPRYMKVVNGYRDSIQEIRIEGHTSSEWTAGVDADTAYFENMRLSQDCTRAVLHYVYMLPSVKSYRPWMKENLAAVGLSSAKTVKDVRGGENKEQSKRVTFRILTNADEQLRKINGEWQ